MTVAEFIALLLTHDQGATVEIVAGQRSRGYGGNGYSREDFNAEEHLEYTDMRGNPHVKPEASYFNKRTLLIGGNP